MTIRAIVFDVGGVLEMTPLTGWQALWEARLNLQPGKLSERLRDVWRGGSIGTLSEADVERCVAERLELDQTQLDAFMSDLWTEYLGTLNVDLATYFAELRPQYQTAILSNSFVGAREREQAHYQFDQLCDFILYSHEVGIAKPDPRIYALLCERLGVQPAEVIFVDDHEEAVDPARALGIHGILFEDTTQVIAAIEACIQAQAK